LDSSTTFGSDPLKIGIWNLEFGIWKNTNKKIPDNIRDFLFT
jgi:hypothetical protein